MTHLGYVDANTPLHRLPPAAKICLVAFTAVFGAVVSTPLGWAAATALTCALVGISRVGARRALAPVASLKWFFLMVMALNAFMFSDQDPVFSWWIFHLTAAGAFQGAKVVAHCVLVVAAGSLLTCVTKPQELVQGVRDLLSPLARLGIPTEVAALSVGVTVQFIPILLQETAHIMKAQKVRMAGASSARITEQIQSSVRLLIPLFVSAIRRADELALAMEARGYRLDGEKNHE